MIVYVLTRMRMVGEAHEAHAVTDNIGATLIESEAEAWKHKDPANSYEALPVILDSALDTSEYVEGINELTRLIDALNKAFGGESHV